MLHIIKAILELYKGIVIAFKLCISSDAVSSAQPFAD